MEYSFEFLVLRTLKFFSLDDVMIFKRMKKFVKAFKTQSQ